MQKSKYKQAIIVFIVLLFPFIFYLFLHQGKHNFKTLPYLSKHSVAITELKDFKKRKINLKNNINIILLINKNCSKKFFEIISNLWFVQDKYNNDKELQFIIVFNKSSCFYNNKEKMMKYIKKNNWYFVINNNIQNYICFLDSCKDNNVVLLDKNRRIRAYSKAETAIQIKKLIDDIQMLYLENNLKKSKSTFFVKKK